MCSSEHPDAALRNECAVRASSVHSGRDSDPDPRPGRTLTSATTHSMRRTMLSRKEIDE